MEGQIILVICGVLLVSYIFDLTASATRLPSVIMLMLLGWAGHQVASLFHVEIPDLAPYLGLLGTIGLILIVLEGSLDLEMSRTSIQVARKSFFLAFLPFALMSGALTWALMYFAQANWRDALINALPFCIISSAIAIPSVQSWPGKLKSLVIYESSLSDIIGVVIFNFIVLNEVFDVFTFLNFGLQILIVLLISLVATTLLSLLLSRLNHHIKYGPIIIIIVSIYAITKIYHLPGLMFIMIFGLTVGNIERLKHKKWYRFFKPESINKEIHQFKDMVKEATFLIRSLFFILFGYLIEAHEVFEPSTLSWSLGITGFIILSRLLVLLVLKIPLLPMLFVAPRGLITIMLFFSILPQDALPLVNKPMVIQVILLSVLLTIPSGWFNKQNPKTPEAISIDDQEETA